MGRTLLIAVQLGVRIGCRKFESNALAGGSQPRRPGTRYVVLARVLPLRSEAAEAEARKVRAGSWETIVQPLQPLATVTATVGAHERSATNSSRIANATIRAYIIIITS